MPAGACPTASTTSACGFAAGANATARSTSVWARWTTTSSRCTTCAWSWHRSWASTSRSHPRVSTRSSCESARAVRGRRRIGSRGPAETARLQGARRARGARELDAQGRGRGRDPRPSRTPHAGGGRRRRLGDHRRTARVLRMHEGLPQCPARSARAHSRVAPARLRDGQRAGGGAPARQARGRGLRLHPRSAARAHAAPRSEPPREVDLALSHRHQQAVPPGVEISAACPGRLRCEHLLALRLRAAPAVSPLSHRAQHRSPERQEPRARYRGIDGRPAPLRPRSRPAHRAPGLALRLLQGSGGRGRGLSSGQAIRAGPAARARGRHRRGRSRGGGHAARGARHGERGPRHPYPPAASRCAPDDQRPAARGHGRPAEVASRGLRPHGDRGLVEGKTGNRRQHRRHSPPGGEPSHGLPRELARGCRPAHPLPVAKRPRAPGDGTQGARLRARELSPDPPAARVPDPPGRPQARPDRTHRARLVSAAQPRVHLYGPLRSLDRFRGNGGAVADGVEETRTEEALAEESSPLGGTAIDARAAIRKKRDGGRLTNEEIVALTAGFTRGRVPDYQVAAWLMAVYFKGLDAEETLALTQAMLHSGEILTFPGLPGPMVDKHSTGGVGDKISIALAPIIAACGGFVPMISGRGLGHTGGTLDKLEAIPGFRTQLSTDEFRKLVRAHGLAFGGQTPSLAPADRLLYSLRDVTATIESIPLIVSSILSKKFASGTRRVVFDVKAGRGAFMRDVKRARELADKLLEVTRGLGFEGSALITAMDQPLGTPVGTALEIAEAVDILHGGGPDDTRMLTMRLAAEMLELSGLAPSVQEGDKAARLAIVSGKAYKKLLEIVEAQDGNPRYVDDPKQIPQAPHKHLVESTRTGYVTALDAYEVGEIVVHLGGGRLRRDDKVDPRVGVLLNKKVGDRVEA